MHPILYRILYCLLPVISLAQMTPSRVVATDPEPRLVQIDAELEQLARFTLRGGVGNTGWFSKTVKSDATSEWVEIQLSESAPIDRIVLFPVLWNDADKGPQADGFPEAFHVIAGTPDNAVGQIIARRGPADQFLPRIAPLVIQIPDTTVTWVRIQSTQLSSHARNAQFRFKLSEVMLFSGERNIALHQHVTTSSETRGWANAAIYNDTLVDGLTPFLMDAASGTKSNPLMDFSTANSAFSFTIDLGQTQPLDGIILHSSDVNEYIPQINPTDFGIPTELVIEGAHTADFSDAFPLLTFHRDSVYQVGNMMPYWFPETACRFVRVVVPQGARPLDGSKQKYCISFAEIEFLANGKNVAKGRKVQFGQANLLTSKNSKSLTDGLNHFGEILSISDWVNQLARRHDLQTERPRVVAALNQHYANQKEMLRTTRSLALLLAIAVLISILVGQLIRVRQMARLKERFAADLHDELGANLHSIGLISDVAQDAQSPEEWKKLCLRIRDLTERTGTAVRHCTNILESHGLYIGLIADMQRAAERIATNLHHDLTLEGETFMEHLQPRTRIDLFLFYKECLVNICRHSGATQTRTELIADKKEIRLCVTDNGCGVAQPPRSLKRRARIMRARLSLETPTDGGTRITLRVRQKINPWKRNDV